MTFSTSSCVTNDNNDELTLAEGANALAPTSDNGEETTLAENKPAIVNTHIKTVDGRTDLISPLYRSDITHVVKIKCGAPKKHEWHVRLDAFKYWRHEDPSAAKYSIAENFTFIEVKKDGPVKPGDIIEIVVDRNMGASSIYGEYKINFPEYSEFGNQGYKIIDASSGVRRAP